MKAPFDVRDPEGKSLYQAHIRDAVAEKALKLTKANLSIFYECWDNRDTPHVFAEAYNGRVRWGTGQFLQEREANLPEPEQEKLDPFHTLTHNRRTAPYLAEETEIKDWVIV